MPPKRAEEERTCSRKGVRGRLALVDGDLEFLVAVLQIQGQNLERIAAQRSLLGRERKTTHHSNGPGANDADVHGGFIKGSGW